MICNELDVVAYHFGEVTDEERKAIEAHLLECKDCLRKYLDVKRSIETADEAAKPSDTARAKLRRAVAKELAPPKKWSWWERPMAFAAAACIVLAAGQAMRALTSGPGSPPYAMTEHH
jgi:anti-sigma factor RsiW